MRPAPRRVARFTLAALLALPLPARADDLLVFAAASLMDVLKDLGAAYEKTSADHVTFSFGGSNDLARQIEAGAPADAFFSADTARVDELVQAGLVEASARRDVLSNVLVIVVPSDSKTPIAAPADLEKLSTIALANPEGVPAGVYARTYLQSVKVWDAIASKVVPTLDVRAALAAVETERADAGIAYSTDAAVSKRVRVAYRVPHEQGPRIVYALAPLKQSTKPGTDTLVRFLASRDATPTYERYGFIVLPAR